MLDSLPVSASVRTFRGALAAFAAALAALAVAACGSSSSGSASQLLRQTFSGSHTVNSGNLNVNLTLTPSGSSTVKGPISLSFGGPFASLGKGKLPESNFNIAITGFGHTGSLAILSTGTNGYITLQGTSYQLPASTFQQLESSFASASGGGSGQSALAKLGIHPLTWLTRPTVVGNDQVGGASTTHISAGVDVPALINDLNTLLSKASSLGISSVTGGRTSIPSSVAGKIQNARVDLWTGSGDKTLRKLVVNLSVPVTGQTSSLLGGLSSAQVNLTMQYANLNQPQTITPPSTVAPFSQFQSKLRSILAAIQSAVGGAVGGTSSSGSSSTGSSSTGSAASATKYGQCIQAAGNDITKLQKCASLINK